MKKIRNEQTLASIYFGQKYIMAKNHLGFCLAEKNRGIKKGSKERERYKKRGLEQ